MKKAVLLLFLLLATIVHAQDTPDYVLRVIADSAIVRAAPDDEAEMVASVFAEDSLVAIGRNIDGQWFEVRHPSRLNAIGWIARSVVAATFEVAKLPMTDLTTGLEGSEPVVDTGVAVLIVRPVELRTAPDRFAVQIATVDALLTLPVVERTPDSMWLKVNYHGTTGWIPEFRTSTSNNLSLIPVSAEYAADARFKPFEIIPVERQLAQIDRLVAYLTPIHDTAVGVANYWQMMTLGETVECLPPAGNYTYYPTVPRDLVELPELRQQERLMIQAIDDINASIEAMRRCGVYTIREIRVAYADAINARAILGLMLRRMETLRGRISGE